MLKVDSFVTVATTVAVCFCYVCHLIWTVIGTVGKCTAIYQGIVMIIKMYSNHAPPCVCFFCLIKFRCMLAWFINAIESIFCST